MPRNAKIMSSMFQSGDEKFAKNWKLDKEEFEAAFSERTKLLITTTPHNPVGE